MNLPIVEIVRRDKTFKRITAFQRDPVGERYAGLEIEHVVITALCSVLEPIVTKPVLQQNPGRLAAQTEAIAQASGSAWADGIKRTETIPQLTAQIRSEIQS